MKTIFIKAVVPDDAEMYSVSYRLPVEPAGMLGYTFNYYRERNPTIITLPSKSQLEAAADLAFPVYDDHYSEAELGFMKGANYVINKIKSQ